MKRQITGFRKDSEGHWVAELECGHGQHTRHDPPWMVREWVTTEEGRNSRLGTELNCVRCDELAKAAIEATLAEAKEALARGYEDAGISGLCDEGRWEAALGALDRIAMEPLIDRIGRNTTEPPASPSKD
jgi:hypothetical protein